MTFCEYCGQRATHTCSGLDIPAVDFCAECAPKHAATCEHITRGESAMVRMG